MSENKLPTDFQHYIHISRYARWLEDEGRRETWPETVDRYISFFAARIEEDSNLSTKDKKELLEILG